MKKHKMRIALFITVFGLVLCGFFTASVAEDTAEFAYTVNEDGATITGYNGQQTEIEIPQEIDGYNVIEIGDAVFKDNHSIISVRLPETIVRIGKKAFYNCSKLITINIPDSVSVIDSEAFYQCNKAEINSLPANIASVGSYAFYYCSAIKDLQIPETMTSVSANAFSCSGITNLSLPDTLTSIGNGAFQKCINIQQLVIPDSVTGIGESAFFGCSGITTLKIGSGITSLPQMAFAHCTGIKKLVLPKSLGIYTDYQNSSASSFYNCKNVTEVVIYGDGPCTFSSSESKCPWFYSKGNDLSFTIEEGITELSGLCVGCTSLKTITLPSTLTSLCGTFSGCSSIESIVLPENLRTLGNSTFSACANLKTVVFNGVDLNIDYEAFKNCTSLNSITIPSCVASIGNRSFLGCVNLREIKIQNGLKTIGKYAFEDCQSLKSITLPESIQLIDEGAFYNCTNLKSICFPASPIRFGQYVFENCSGLQAILCRQDTTADVWARSAGYGSNIYYIDQLNPNEISVLLTPLPSIEVGTSVDLYEYCVIYPLEYAHRELYFSCTDADIMSIENTSILTGRSVGSADILVALSCDGSVQASQRVTVYTKPTSISAPSDVYIPEGEKSEILKTAIMIEPMNSTYTLTWESDNPIIASVNSDGRINGVCKGNTVIYSRTDNGIIGETTVHVTGRLDNVAFVEDEISIDAGSNCIVTATGTVDGHTYTNEFMTFQSADTGIVSVDNSGRIQALTSGKTVVTVSTSNGAADTVTVDVKYNCDYLGHVWLAATYTWSDDNRSVKARRICLADELHEEVETVSTRYSIAESPTMDKAGQTTYTASFKNPAFTEQKLTVRDICALREYSILTLPLEIKRIGDEAFEAGHFECVIIPEGCETIGSKAFANCPSLEYIQIPSTVTSIADDAFSGSAHVRIDKAE